MANTSTVIIITAGSITFGTEWYVTKNLDWKVPIATVLIAGAFEALSSLDQKSATLLSIMVLLGAATTEFDGKSFVNILTALGPSSSKTTGSSKLK
jgi:hypothetical protein